MKSVSFLYLVIVSVVACSCLRQKKDGITVIFPKISGPVQVTDNSSEHFLASYYGINSFDRTERYVTVLETNIKNRLPDENDPATLGLVDLSANRFIPLTQTHSWNFQQGCMAHWLATSPDSLIIYNDLRDGKFVSVIMNAISKKEIKTIPFPVSAVSPDGREALSINFSRLRLTRPDYGYGGSGQDPHKDIPFPASDGLFLVNLETSEAKLLVSYEQVKGLVPPIQEGQIAWFNHTLFSRKGSKIFFLSRQKENDIRITTAFTVNKDGTDLKRCFPDGWGGSHFDWLNDDELMVTAAWQGKQYGHVLFTPGRQDYRRLGRGVLDFDAHGTFSPDGRWMVTDTYPDAGLSEQKIFLMEMKSEAVLCLGRFTEPAEFNGFWRCDLHCRWSPDGDKIAFNSTRTGSRQVYLFKLSF